MGVQIVLNQNDFFGVEEMRVGQIAQDMGILDRGTPRANGNIAPSFQGGRSHEQAGHNRPGLPGSGLRVSRVNCFDVSSRQTSGRLGSWGR